MVVAAKMTTSRWSWKNGVIRKDGSRGVDLEVSFRCPSQALVSTGRVEKVELEEAA
jgi:hypothetical protein